jgi:uncharacterized protein YuzE
MDIDNDGDVSDIELSNAIKLLEKAKSEKNKKLQKQAFLQFANYEHI